jgi:hypothetical protein
MADEKESDSVESVDASMARGPPGRHLSDALSSVLLSRKKRSYLF